MLKKYFLIYSIMEDENKTVLKGIFQEMNEAMADLKVLKITIKKNKDGEIEVDFSTCNSGSSEKPKKEKKEVAKGKTPAKSSLKKSVSIRNKTKRKSDESD